MFEAVAVLSYSLVNLMHCKKLLCTERFALTALHDKYGTL